MIWDFIKRMLTCITAIGILPVACGAFTEASTIGGGILYLMAAGVLALATMALYESLEGGDE